MTKERQGAAGRQVTPVPEQAAGQVESPDSVGREAWAAMYRVAEFLRQRAFVLASEYELSPAQMHLLHCLEPSAPMSMSQAAQTLGCDASNVTGLTDRLEKRGFVERQPAAQDRRVKMLVLTPHGETQRAALVERLTAVPAIFKRLSFTELKTLRDIMRRAAELQAAADAEGAPKEGSGVSADDR